MSTLTLPVPIPIWGDGPIIDVSTMVGPKTVVLSGTFEGYYVLLASQDDLTFVPILEMSSGSAEPIQETIAGSIKSVRLRSLASSQSGVSCRITAESGVGLNHFTTIASLTAGFSGHSSPVDLAALFPPSGLEVDTCLICRGGFRGLLVVEGSADGTTYRPIGAFRIDRLPDGSPTTVDFSVLAIAELVRYLRVYLDGPTTDATVVTLGGRTTSLVVSASPAGLLVAPAGTRAYLDDGTAAWDNVDGGTTWTLIGASAPSVAEVATVAKSGAQYTSVAVAVAAVTPLVDAAHPWVITVASGVYVEPPFTIPQYVTIQGIGFAVLQAANNSVDFITGSPGSLLNYATIFGPTGFGAAAIRYNTVSPNSFLVSNVILARGYYGAHVSAGNVLFNTLLNLVAGAGFTEFLRVDGGSCLLTGGDYEGPVGSVARAFVVTGAGAELNLTNTIFSCPGATGIFADDGAKLVLDLVQLVSGSTAIHVGSSGAPQLLARATAIREGGGGGFTTNLRVDTAAATIHYYGAMSRNKFVLASGVSLEASFQDVTPGSGGSTTIGNTYSSRAGNPNVVLPTSQYRLDTNWTGVAGEGDGGVTKAGGLVLSIAANHGYINNSVDMFRVDWGAQTITLTPNTMSYVYVDEDGVVQQSVSQPNYDLVFVLAQAVTNGTDVVLLTRDEVTTSYMLSRSQEYLEDVIGPIGVGGGTTTINAGDQLALDVDPGTFVVGLSERPIVGGSAVTFTYWYETPSGWVAVPGNTHVDTSRYNDITTGLVALTGTNWKKDLLYVVANAGGDEYHVIYGQEQFATQIAAEQGNYPAPPYVLEHYAMRSGGVVSQRAALLVTSTTDARPRIGGFVTTAGVTDHGALTGLGDDDHLQYLTTTRADTWHQSTPVAGAAHVKNGNLHVHGLAGDGGQVDHVNLANIGTYTHSQLDSHVNSVANPHVTTYSQVGAPPTTRQVIAGSGLAGGGDLSADRTLSVLPADGTIAAGAGGVRVDTISDANVAAANKDGFAGTPSMRTLGTGALQACSGSDARLTDSRAPTGGAGGDLSGTYPSPSIAPLSVTDAKVAAANKDGLAATPAMRTLGTGAQQACSGSDARLSDARLPLGYQAVQSTGNTAITGVNSNVYPPTGPGTKLTLTTASLTGTYRLSWHGNFTYSNNNRDAFVRIRNTTDSVTLAEKVQRYASAATAVDEIAGFADVVFAGAVKSFAIEFHNSNTGDTITMSNAYLDLWRVG